MPEDAFGTGLALICMCQRVTCPQCGKPTWSGCGRHVEEALAGVPRDKRCTCPPPKPLLERLFGRRRG